MDKVQPFLLTELYGWACWRFNLEVKVQQQEQQVFYTINVDPFGHRLESHHRFLGLCTLPEVGAQPHAKEFTQLTPSQKLNNVGDGVKCPQRTAACMLVCLSC